MDVATFKQLLSQVSAAYEHLHGQFEGIVPTPSQVSTQCSGPKTQRLAAVMPPQLGHAHSRQLGSVLETGSGAGSAAHHHQDRHAVLNDDEEEVLFMSGASEDLRSPSGASGTSKDDFFDDHEMKVGATVSQRDSVRNSWSAVGRRKSTSGKRPQTNWVHLVLPLLEKRPRMAMRTFWEEINKLETILCRERSDADNSTDDWDTDAVLLAWSHTRLRPSIRRAFSGLRTLSAVPESKGYFSSHISSHCAGKTFEDFVISPLSWKKSLWMLIGAMVVFTDFFLLTLTFFGSSLEGGGASFWDTFNAVFWSIDMVFVFFTGLYIKLEVVTDFAVIVRHYFSRWFLFDAAMLSIQWSLLIMSNMKDEKLMKVLKYVKFGKYFRLLRLAKIEVLLTRALEMVNSVHMLSVMKMLGHCTMVALYVHCSATAWYLTSLKVGSSTWDVDAHGREELQTFPLNYFMALHWAVAQLQGTCDIYPGRTAGERAFAAFHVLVSVVVMATLFGNLAALMHQMVVLKAKKELWVNTARHYLEDNHINKELSLRVRKYVHWAQVHTTSRDQNENEMLQLLPFSLRCEVLEETRRPVLLGHCVFSALRNIHQRSWQRLVCDNLSTVVHMPGDFVFCYGQVCESMKFLISGEARYYRYDELMQSVLKCGGRDKFGRGANYPMSIRDLVDENRSQRAVTLTDGASFSEASLWVDWVHCGDTSAVQQVSLLSLTFQDFSETMQLDPATKHYFVTNAFRFVQVLNSLVKEKANDLTTSSQILEIVDVDYGTRTDD